MAAINLAGVWLHDTADPAGTAVHLRFNGDGAEETRASETVYARYPGRRYPAVDFGDAAERSVAVTAETEADLAGRDPTLTALAALCDRPSVLCYRDARGRKIFGTCRVESITDTFYGSTVKLAVAATDWAEGT
jgi:hypothetical protein